MKKFQLASCTSPSVTFEIGSNIIKTDVIKNTKKNPNFGQNVFYKEMVSILFDFINYQLESYLNLNQFESYLNLNNYCKKVSIVAFGRSTFL